jgi:NAD(P)-dependent dehydrogenase (short-subunit alcohol dehydrogenase family)
MKNIVITGASTGIGYATTQLFIQKGCRVFGSVRTEADAKKRQNDFGSAFIPLIFDVRDGEAVRQAAALVKNTVGTEGVFLLVNNAGVAVSGPLQHIDFAEFKMQFDINVLGVQQVTQAFLPLLGATLDPSVPKGKIVNISSVSAVVASPFLGPYCASKVALDFWGDSLRRELMPFGVGVVSVQPGPVATPIWDKARDNNLYPKTEYASMMQVSQKIIERSEKNAIPAQRVAEKIWTIAHNPNPKTRYMVASNALVVKFASLLPHKWLDAVFFNQLKKVLNGSK